MKTNKIFALMASAAMVFSMASCEKPGEGPNGGGEEKPTAAYAKILSFNVSGADMTLKGNVYENDKVVEIPYDETIKETVFAALSSATAEVEISDGATISPDPAEARDYTDEANPVVFTVTSKDGKIVSEYKVNLIEGEFTSVCEEVWKKTQGELLGEASYIGQDGSIAFSGFDIVTFDGQVFDLDGNKIGDLNRDGVSGEILSMTNDEHGCLVATVIADADGNRPSEIDNFTESSTLYAWVDGWQNAPKLLKQLIRENNMLGIQRYISVAGDVKNNEYILMVVGGAWRTADQWFHLNQVRPANEGENPTFGDGVVAWSQFKTKYVGNDGSWNIFVSPCSNDINDTFFILDSNSDNKGMRCYVRKGRDGQEDKELPGTLSGEHSGHSGFGNYSQGHLRAFKFSNRNCAVVCSSGWPSGYVTVLDENGNYLMETVTYAGDAPRISSAYIYDEATETGHIVVHSSPHMFIKYELTGQLM